MPYNAEYHDSPAPSWPEGEGTDDPPTIAPYSLADGERAEAYFEAAFTSTRANVERLFADLLVAQAEASARWRCGDHAALGRLIRHRDQMSILEIEMCRIVLRWRNTILRDAQL